MGLARFPPRLTAPERIAHSDERGAVRRNRRAEPDSMRAHAGWKLLMRFNKALLEMIQRRGIIVARFLIWARFLCVGRTRAQIKGDKLLLKVKPKRSSLRLSFLDKSGSEPSLTCVINMLNVGKKIRFGLNPVLRPVGGTEAAPKPLVYVKALFLFKSGWIIRLHQRIQLA